MWKVLIVEDDPMVAKINKVYVESVEAFKVVGIAKDYKEAISILRREQVDLVILDIYLPGEVGIHILEEIRKNQVNCDVIMVTASAEVDKIDKALKLGVVDYLIKPFEYERLKIALENYKSRYNTLSKKNGIDQEDLDKILVSNVNATNDVVPKGLNRLTLNRIVSFVEDNGNRLLSAEEIAERLDVTTVTVRRYMNYLERIGLIACVLEYGSVGRPKYLYKKVD